MPILMGSSYDSLVEPLETFTTDGKENSDGILEDAGEGRLGDGGNLWELVVKRNW